MTVDYLLGRSKTKNHPNAALADLRLSDDMIAVSYTHLDVYKRQEIHRALDALMKDKTVIVIAHRLNTIIGADQILVLERY